MVGEISVHQHHEVSSRKLQPVNVGSPCTHAAFAWNWPLDAACLVPQLHQSECSGGDASKATSSSSKPMPCRRIAEQQEQCRGTPNPSFPARGFRICTSARRCVMTVWYKREYMLLFGKLHSTGTACSQRAACFHTQAHLLHIVCEH